MPITHKHDGTIMNKADIKQWLAQRKADNLYRQVTVTDSPQSPYMMVKGKKLLSFCSNNYLGLANHPNVIAAFKKTADQYGVGSGASHLVNGHSRPHQALEEALADFVQRDKVLLFSNGFAANLGVIDAMTDKKSTVVQDRLNHASLLDGVRLSGARLKRYQHTDYDHLTRLLAGSDKADNNNTTLVASDTVFSMDGDTADIKQLSRASHQHHAWLYVDDAHGIGVVGDGRGVVLNQGLSQEEVPLLMATFGKALGTSGAFVAGDADVLDYIAQKARPWIYTTAMPPAIAGATLASLKLVQEDRWRQTHLKALIKQLKLGLNALPWELIPSNTAIQPILVGNEREALQLSDQLLQAGIWVTAIRYPTVAKGQARLRITLTAEHEETDITLLLNALQALA